MTRPFHALILASASLLATSAPALAQGGYAPAGDSGDTALMVMAAVLGLLLLLPGIGLFVAGRLNRQDAERTLSRSLGVVAVVSLLWIMAGYTLAFGMITAGWLGAGNAWMLIDLAALRPGLSIPESSFALFHLVLALIPPVLMTGAWTGRTAHAWTLAFCGLWSLMVFAPLVHWMWGGGWLASRFGVLDYAGGLVIHAATAISALIVLLLLGPRETDRHEPSNHAPIMATGGGMMLWAGWLAMAGGFAYAATDDASTAIINTQAAACAGALAWAALARWRGPMPGQAGFAGGALAGLVTVAPAALFVSPGGAIVIGVIGAGACRGAIHLIRNRLKLDDRLNIVAIHGAGGIGGALLAALFVHPWFGGTGYEAGLQFSSQLLAQALAVGVVVLWSAIVSTILALACSLVLPMQTKQLLAEASGQGDTSS